MPGRYDLNLLRDAVIGSLCKYSKEAKALALADPMIDGIQIEPFQHQHTDR